MLYGVYAICHMLCTTTHIACSAAFARMGMAAEHGNGDVLGLVKSCFELLISSGYPATRLLLLLVPISQAVMLTQLLRISYDVIRRSLLFKWKYAILIPISVSAFPPAFAAWIRNREFAARPASFPCAFCGKTFARWVAAAALRFLWKWSKIKLNYGNWKWKAKIKRIMSRNGGGFSWAERATGRESVEPRLKQQATTIQGNIIKGRRQTTNCQIMRQKLAWSNLKSKTKGPGRLGAWSRRESALSIALMHWAHNEPAALNVNCALGGTWKSPWVAGLVAVFSGYFCVGGCGLVFGAAFRGSWNACAGAFLQVGWRRLTCCKTVKRNRLECRIRYAYSDRIFDH